ncbi:MAG: hypothetical protein GF372_14610 [Candidatus Marinimicrobia bacterium]|nr:hypothetical protein [Candidatus Neomarinimicrobiota bacterium]
MSTYGQPKFPIPKKKSIQEVLKFIQTQIDEFRKKCIKEGINLEDKLTQELCILLERHSRNQGKIFQFQSQYIEHGLKTSVDIGVILVKGYSSKAFLTLEAKRLPPTNHRDYVQGRTGGIERYKLNQHGKNLQRGVLIGYVQKNTFKYWFKEINKWIDEKIYSGNQKKIKWTTGDKLNKKKINTNVAIFESNNSRVISKNIILTHIWILMYD